MTLKDDEERRQAKRFALPRPAAATFGGFEAEIIEVSLIGCQITHADRIAPRARLSLRFKWRGKPVRLDATVMRSEMRSVRGKPAYMSGLAFCETAAESPALIREIVGWLEDALRIAEPEPVEETPAITVPDDEADVVGATYLQCTLSGGTWDKFYVESPEQPPEGFTIPVPQNEAEADVLCRAYASANAAKRRDMRAAFAATIAHSRGQ